MHFTHPLTAAFSGTLGFFENIFQYFFDAFLPF